MQGNIPPPETGVVVAHFPKEQRREHKTDGHQLELRWYMYPEAPLQQHREKGDNDDQRGEKTGEPASGPHRSHHLKEKHKLQEKGDSLVGNPDAHGLPSRIDGVMEWGVPFAALHPFIQRQAITLTGITGITTIYGTTSGYQQDDGQGCDEQRHCQNARANPSATASTSSRNQRA
ncbi:hypothetical protein GCM10007071_16160 [Marinobacter zhanjiangensis]|uniref:Uncharacterized protein n=1 Tax=Marinobacter zhanjiangensis TaxID=578215 RepID=A0ABQ3AYP8_9GAMM|nr:hypothetical protein GCM10007071_16160 [Marinobacter zhanjiangensis]